MGISTKEFTSLCGNLGLNAITELQLMNAPEGQQGKRSKYGVDQSAAGKLQRTCDGITFDSKVEMRHYQTLKIAQQAGMISGLELQPKFLLQEKFTDTQGRKHRAVFYVADFRFTREGKTVVVDVKSGPTKTAQFRLKWKMVPARYPDVVWEMWA